MSDLLQDALAERWLALLDTKAGGDARKAAKLAGYKRPGMQATRLLRRYAERIAQDRAARQATAQATEAEILERLTAIIRDPSHRDHLKAVELGLRVHGKLSDKAHVEEPKSALVREIGLLIEGIGGMRKGPKTLIATSLPTTGLPS